MTPPVPKAAITGLVCRDMTRHIRDFLDFAISSEKHGAGIYYFGIVASACYLESVLEDFSVLWCKTKDGGDGLESRVYEKLAKDISRATGLDPWKGWMRLLFDIDLARTLEQEWPTLKVLFELRNQLAHGRTTKLTHFWDRYGRFVGMSLKGSSYKTTFEFLIERNVLTIRPGNVPSAECLLTRDVVRHFLAAVDRAIATLRQVPALSRLMEDYDGSGSIAVVTNVDKSHHAQ
jgi:hypothetical protein